MSKLLTDEVSGQIKPQLDQLRKPVRLLFSTEPHACGACVNPRELLETVTALSDNLSLKVHELVSKEAVEYSIDKVPSTKIAGPGLESGILNNELFTI